jgi:very-short-patch-repair endonuclease
LKVDFRTGCKVRGLIPPVGEWLFHPERMWRLDWAWPEAKIALEIDGGTWTGGRHTRGKGYAEDCRKLNEATAMGWSILRVTPEMIDSGEAFGWLERVLASRESSQ